jgi:prophage DNA circulation protein
MALHRNWAKSLRRASFRGVPFHVDDEEVRNFLRQAVHEVPNGMWRIERLGRGPTELSLTGFVASRTADTEGDAVAATFRDDKPGQLVMPMVGPLQARPLSCFRHRSARREGYVALDMRWIVEPVRGPSASPAQAANSIFSAAGGLVSSIAGQISGVVGFALQVAGTVSSAIGMVSSIVGTVTSIYGLVTSVSSAAIAVATTVLGYRVGEIGRSDANRVGLLTDIAQAAIDLGYGMSADAVAAGAFQPLFDVEATPRSGASRSAAAAYLAEAGLASFSHAVGLVVEAEAIARREWSTVEEVDEALSGFLARVDVIADDLAALNSLAAVLQPDFERVLMPAPRVGADAPAASSANAGAALDELRSAVVDYLAIVSRDLAPLVIVESNRSLPAIVWAFALYEDPDRAGELARMNRVRSPSFMPVRFRALAPASSAVSEI